MTQWRDVAGYEGLYRISDEGDVIALPRIVECNGKLMHRKGNPIKPHLRGKNGLYYVAVSLSKNGKTKAHSVHRLVAEAFLPNENGLPEINHKDENPFNNRVDNLEWCSRQYNIDYSKSKPVAQIDGGRVVARFKSIKEAGRQTGIKRTGINNVLTGWAETAGGFHWAYCD